MPPRWRWRGLFSRSRHARFGLSATLLIAAGAAPQWSGWASLPSSSSGLGLAAVAGGLLALFGLLLHRLLSLQREREHGQAALDMTGVASADWQVGRDHSIASPAWLDLLGAPTARSLPTRWLDGAHPLDRERALAALEALLAAPGSGDQARVSLRLRQPAGAWCWYELRARALGRNATGRARRLLLTLTDISWQRTADERQRMSVSLFQHLHEGLLVTDAEYRVLDANPSCCRMLGLPREALVGQMASLLQAPNLRRCGLDPAQLEAALSGQGFWQARIDSERADGTPCSLDLTVSAIPEPDGPERYRVISISDLTETLRQQQRLARQASFDEVTGLPNHAEFMRTLQQGLLAAEREGFRLAICRVDLDQFKRINRQHGGPVADAALVQVAQRLRGALRNAPQWSDAVARLSGDEFALLLRMNSAEEAQLALERLLNVLRVPYPVAAPESGRPLSLEISASIGATLFPLDNADAETLMRHAGHALFRAKHAGRNGFHIFDSAKRLQAEASLLQLARVQQALDAGELRLFYQPKVDMQTGRVMGMEALLRWQHPERGLLAPAHFLPLIERTGLAVHVGDWVIEQALKQSAQWLTLGLSLNVSVNVTARQLQMPDFAQRLQELINRHAEPVAAHLSLEVLESAALADIAATTTLMQRCLGFGVNFALDDFGTGYSTLTYLKKLPVNALKIDRSFVQHMLIDAQDMALVEGVIGLARNFGCTVIAEGVESAAHARALLRLGCQQGQGNGIAAAMPAVEVPAWIEAFSRSPWRMQSGIAEQAY